LEVSFNHSGVPLIGCFLFPATGYNGFLDMGEKWKNNFWIWVVYTLLADGKNHEDYVDAWIKLWIDYCRKRYRFIGSIDV